MSAGGLGDIYVMRASTPEQVVLQYFTMIGKPVLTPQWALGWHQCRWGYSNLAALKEVVTQYANNQLPLDVQWSDIDYLNKYRNFEVDPVNFAGLGDFVKELHGKNMKYVPILDAGLAYRLNDDYSAFTDGYNKDVFLKLNGEIFVGEVWPSDAVYPDYYAKNTAQWWQDNLDSMYKQVEFDGLWEDMNEAANFCNGVCHEKQKYSKPIKHSLRYVPTGRDLEVKSIALDAEHANGLRQIDTHSLYGIQEI